MTSSKGVVASIEKIPKSFSAIARFLEENVDIRDRRYRLKVYKRSFIGSDAVSVLLQVLKSFDPSFTRQHAELLGRNLESKLGLFAHVCNDHHLLDDYYMYRFTHESARPATAEDDHEETAEYLQRLLADGIHMVGEESAVFDEAAAVSMMMDTMSNGDSSSIRSNNVGQSMGDRVRTGLNSAVSVLISPSNRKKTAENMMTMSLPNLPMLEDALGEPAAAESKPSKLMLDPSSDFTQIALAFESGVEVKTNRYLGKAYKKTFIGTDAVDFILACRWAKSRREAETVGQELMQRFNLFRHCTGDHGFLDNYYFYEFTERWERKGIMRSKRRGSTVATLESIAMEFEKQVLVSDRRFRLKSYKACFVGSEAVSFLVGGGFATTRTRAVALGRRLMSEINLFEHVTCGRDFEDDYYFYRFTPEDDRIHRSTAAQSSLQSIIDSPTELLSLADKFRKGIHVGTHVYRLKMYKRTFVGSAAVDLMVDSNLSTSRREAVKLGQKMMKELNLFHGVPRGHRFCDDVKFFRFAEDEGETVSTALDRTTPMDVLQKIADAMRMDIKVKSRRWYHRVYKKTFLGTEAVTYLKQISDAETREEAVQIGRELAHYCNLFGHVEGDHELKDEKLFYCFTAPKATEEDEQDLSSLRSIALEFEKGVEVKSNKFHLRVYHKTFIGEEAVQFLLDRGAAKTRSEAVSIGRRLAATFNLFEHVTRSHEFEDAFYFYRFTSESRRLLWGRDIPEVRDKVEDSDMTWHKKIDDFERKSRNRSNAMEILSGPMIWAASFRRLDPRWRILEFFSEVAQLGVDGVQNGRSLAMVHPLLRFVSMASVFTVWRPTQFDAIRKMMLGKAVGKGLDIKGKSAKRGKLAGYVPFLQISDNRHKRLIRTIPKAGSIRIFFSSEGGDDARDSVVDRLEEVAKEMMETVQQAKLVLADPADTDSSTLEEAKEALLHDMSDSSITYLDDYHPDCVGLEVSMRLFWEAFIVRQDCTREVGSRYDTGRPSTPAFQDMNIAALLAKPASESPRAVLWQHSRGIDPMNPHELLMAYEEHGRVLPVASDFDALLVGTRRVRFDPVAGALPQEQVKMLKWQVNQIGRILDEPTRPENWTSRWLEVLKREGYHPKIPRFGFGDPRSYSLMENAIQRLVADGSVRHGAECFNYYFPQELDEEFLVISSTLGKIPWKYMNAEELQEFLNARIDNGFTFPLNPKWVVCDPGWKSLYDKLLRCSGNEAENSMKIWFPPDSGIREQIEDICTRHPGGFQRGVRVTGSL